MTAGPPVTEFNCPNCAVSYKLVRVEVNVTSPYREITCLKCGGPLNGRDGRSILKYFLAAEPSGQTV